jgi:hypothetical protein
MYSIYLVYIYNIIYIYIYMLAYESYGLLLYTLTYIYIYTWVIYSNERWNLLSSTFGIWGHDSGKAARDAASSELVGLATSRRRVKGAASVKVQRIWAPGPRWDVHFWWLEMTKHAIGVSTAVSCLLNILLKILLRLLGDLHRCNHDVIMTWTTNSFRKGWPVSTSPQRSQGSGLTMFDRIFWLFKVFFNQPLINH